MKLTEPQLEVLSLIADGFHYEPAEIWLDHSSYNNAPSALGLRNFGRTMDVLVKLGLVERDDHGYTITAAGLKEHEAQEKVK